VSIVGIALTFFQDFFVESTTSHMLSQPSKTIKLALKSMQDERAILRARSAVQRFPVVEWCQQMEDMHRRSVPTSRHLAGPNVWRESDRSIASIQVMDDTDDWNPVHQGIPLTIGTHQAWARRRRNTDPSYRLRMRRSRRPTTRHSSFRHGCKRVLRRLLQTMAIIRGGVW
jgi:hypothetical protein